MEAEGILIALAEVAIAIAGFSGIVVALQYRAAVWSDIDTQMVLGLWCILPPCRFRVHGYGGQGRS